MKQQRKNETRHHREKTQQLVANVQFQENLKRQQVQKRNKMYQTIHSIRSNKEFRTRIKYKSQKKQSLSRESCSNQSYSASQASRQDVNQEYQEFKYLQKQLLDKDECERYDKAGAHKKVAKKNIEQPSSTSTKFFLLGIIENLIESQKNELSTDQRNDLISVAMVEEYIKQKRLEEVIEMVDSLKTQKPEYFKQFYDQMKMMQTQQSESEVSALKEYWGNKNDEMWTKFEKEGKKKDRFNKQNK